MKCVNCGKKLKSNEKFCTYCGYYNDSENEETFSKEIPEEDWTEQVEIIGWLYQFYISQKKCLVWQELSLQERQLQSRVRVT